MSVTCKYTPLTNCSYSNILVYDMVLPPESAVTAGVALVRRFYESWAVQNIEGALDVLSEDFIYRLHMSPSDVPFAGVTSGRDNFRSALTDIVGHFEHILFRPHITSEQASGTINARVEVLSRHRPTGAEYHGWMRDVWQCSDDKLSTLDSYHDAAKFEAFMRMVGSS